MRHCLTVAFSLTQRILISDPPDEGVTRELVWPSAVKALLPVSSRDSVKDLTVRIRFGRLSFS